MSNKDNLPAIKEKDFFKDVESLVKTMTSTLIVKPSEIEKIKIESEDDFAIADNSMKNIKENLDLFDSNRKGITSPFDAIKKRVMTLFKDAIIPLEESKSILSKKLTSWKQVQRATAEATAKREKEELDSKSEKDIEELKRMNRIEHNLYVRLFGGESIMKDLSREKKRPCQNTLDVENAIEWVESKFPSIDDFPDNLREDSIRVKEMFLMVARSLKKAFFDSESDHAGTRDDALNQIMTMNSDYLLEVENRRAERKGELSEQIKSVEKTIEKTVGQEKKGFRKDVVFEILNSEVVPERFKMVDEKKVKDFKTQNREKIMRYIKDGKDLEIIQGLKFSIKEKYTG